MREFLPAGADGFELCTEIAQLAGGNFTAGLGQVCVYFNLHFPGGIVQADIAFFIVQQDLAAHGLRVVRHCRDQGV